MSVKGGRPLHTLALLLIGAALIAGCSPRPRPAPAGTGAYWPTYLGDLTRAPFLRERVSPDSPRVVWSANVGSGVRSMPIVTDEVVVVGTTDRYLYVVSRQDGSLYWRKRVDGPLVAPLLAGDRIYAFAENEGKLHVLELREGDELSKLDFPSVSVPPAMHEGILYAAGDDGTLRAIDPDGRREIWQARLRRRPVAGPVVLDSEVLYFAADSLYTMDRGSGARVRAVPMNGRVVGEAASDGERLYSTTERGSIVAQNLHTLDTVWEATGFDAFQAGPVLAPDAGYAVARSGQIVRFDPADGGARILARLDRPVAAAPVLVSNGLLVGSLEGDLFFLDRNGSTLWRVKLEGSIEHPVYVHEGRLVVPMYGPVSGPLGAEPLRGKLLELR